MCVNFEPSLLWQPNPDAAGAGVQFPIAGCVSFGFNATTAGAGVNATIDVGKPDVPGAGVRGDFAFGSIELDTARASVELDIIRDLADADVTGAGFGFDRSFKAVDFHAA